MKEKKQHRKKERKKERNKESKINNDLLPLPS
jgi:hypothetical protein